MEIRNYVRIAWRWLWLIVALPALVLAFSLVRPAPQETGYTANMRFTVGITPKSALGPTIHTIVTMPG